MLNNAKLFRYLLRGPRIQSNVINQQRWRQHSSRCNMDIETLVQQLKERKLSQIVVIRTPFEDDPKMIVLANSFNQRHLNSATELLNKYYKNNVRDGKASYARINESPGWNVIDFDSIITHLFLPPVRKKYDIEQLWCVGEEYDELINHPVEEQPVTNFKYFIEKLREQEEKDKEEEDRI